MDIATLIGILLGTLLLLGSMVSLRGTIHRQQEGSDGVCGVVVQKDRRRGPGYRLSYRYRAPHGVC